MPVLRRYLVVLQKAAPYIVLTYLAAADYARMWIDGDIVWNRLWLKVKSKLLDLCRLLFIDHFLLESLQLQRLGDLVQSVEKAEYLPRFENLQFFHEVRCVLVLENQVHHIIQVLLKSADVVALHVLEHAVHDVKVGDLGIRMALGRLTNKLSDDVCEFGRCDRVVVARELVDLRTDVVVKVEATAFNHQVEFLRR